MCHAALASQGRCLATQHLLSVHSVRYFCDWKELKRRVPVSLECSLLQAIGFEYQKETPKVQYAVTAKRFLRLVSSASVTRLDRRMWKMMLQRSNCWQVNLYMSYSNLQGYAQEFHTMAPMNWLGVQPTYLLDDSDFSSPKQWHSAGQTCAHHTILQIDHKILSTHWGNKALTRVLHLLQSTLDFEDAMINGSRSFRRLSLL